MPTRWPISFAVIAAVLVVAWPGYALQAAGSRWNDRAIRQEAVPKPATDPATATMPGRTAVPSWARDARWYNVDASHDGGKLQSLSKRLPYLRELGLNSLYLSSIFRAGEEPDSAPVDIRHVDGAHGVGGTPGQPAGETLDPKTWRFSAGDRAFLAFLNEAHEQGFRVAVEAPFGARRKTLGADADAGKYLLAVTRRWMDPNGDGDPADGVDAWVPGDPHAMPHAFWKRWRAYAKKINPRVLLIADVRGDATPWLGGDEFDVAVNYGFAGAIRRLFGAGDQPGRLKTFLTDLEALSRRYTQDIVLASPVPLGGRDDTDGVLSAALLTRSGKDGKGNEPAPVADSTVGLSRRRVASVLQYCFPGAPMVYQGEDAARLASLIQFLNIRRDVDKPLRRGGFRRVMLDEERGLIAFGRSLPDEEVVLLVNCGNAKQKVILPVGRPGQMVGVLGPRIQGTPRPTRKPGPGKGKLVEPLGVGGSRRIVDAQGHIRLWINPMTVRLVIVQGP